MHRALYRPRQPEQTAFYQIFAPHFDQYVGIYEERFEHRYGPLHPAVARAVEEFLACGRLLGGFARLRCPSCRREHLLAFSCQTRNLCPSCQAKKAILLANRPGSGKPTGRVASRLAGGQVYPGREKKPAPPRTEPRVSEKIPRQIPSRRPIIPRGWIRCPGPTPQRERMAGQQ